jgi:hypothetical protein
MQEIFTPQPPITPHAKFSTAGRAPAYRILLNGPFLAISVITLFVALLARMFEVGGNDSELFLALGTLCSTIFMVRALYLKSERFMFSPTFWVLVTVFFYFVLKSVDWWSKDLITPTLVEAIWLCALFLVAYAIVYALMDARLRYAAPRSHREQVIAPGAPWALFAVYAAFKLLGVALFASAGGSNALEVAAVTQNGGAAYLYRLPAIGNILFLALLFNSFKNNRNWNVTKLALILYLLEAMLTTNRLALIMVVMWWTFLYHRYRHPISMLRMTLIGLPLLVILVLFGYARNIEVGSFTAYLNAASALAEQPTLISDLFMQRMDMLPQFVESLDILRAGVLPELNGASYLYAFLHAVPRSVWEAKPLLTAALATSETHPGAFAAGVNIFPSILFEGMMNLSYAGVILSATLLAFFSRQLERAVEADRLVPSVWALSMLTFPMALFNEGFHSNFTGNFLYVTVLTALLYQALKSVGLIKRRRSHA